MTEPLCRTCIEALLGPAVMEKVRRIVDAAPALRPEQAEDIRAVFASERAIRGPEDPSPEPCGCGRATGG